MSRFFLFSSYLASQPLFTPHILFFSFAPKILGCEPSKLTCKHGYLMQSNR